MSRLLVVWLMEKGGEKGGRTDARLPRIGIPFPLVQGRSRLRGCNHSLWKASTGARGAEEKQRRMNENSNGDFPSISSINLFFSRGEK